MAKYAVYHYDMKKLYYGFGKWSFRNNIGEITEPCTTPLTMEDYELVAIVDTPSLEGVFESTNHIHDNWELNDNVTTFKNGNRSTSVGDMVLNLDTLGRFFCNSFGWDEMEAEKAEV